MAIVPWIGERRVAIVPVFDRQVDSAPPPDWSYQVRNRVFYDLDPATGVDRSFQAFLRSLSYGQASIAGEVFPVVGSDGPEVNTAAMNSLPAGHGYKHLLAVLPHSVGVHRGGHAFEGGVNGFESWARVAMFDDLALTRRQPLGVWGQELLHSVAKFWGHTGLGAYDVMDGTGAMASTHASTHTKSAVGWLRSGIRAHPTESRRYVLQAVALPQPPPPGRVAAVRIPSRSGGHYMVEARLRVDQYERNDAPGDGLPAEGVLVYKVYAVDNVVLQTPIPLSPGERFENAQDQISVRVDRATQEGFAVTVTSEPHPECSSLRARVEELSEMIQNEDDEMIKRELREERDEVRDRADRLGCP